MSHRHWVVVPAEHTRGYHFCHGMCTHPATTFLAKGRVDELELNKSVSVPDHHHTSPSITIRPHSHSVYQCVPHVRAVFIPTEMHRCCNSFMSTAVPNLTSVWVVGSGERLKCRQCDQPIPITLITVSQGRCSQQQCS